MQPTQVASSSTGNVGGAASGGNSANNQQPADAPLKLNNAAQGDSRGEKVNQDADAGGLKFEKEPWFAKLPPNLRKAIEAKTRRDPPRGYEERLRRYFESVD